MSRRFSGGILKSNKHGQSAEGWAGLLQSSAGCQCLYTWSQPVCARPEVFFSSICRGKPMPILSLSEFMYLQLWTFNRSLSLLLPCLCQRPMFSGLRVWNLFCCAQSGSGAMNMHCWSLCKLGSSVSIEPAPAAHGHCVSSTVSLIFRRVVRPGPARVWSLGGFFGLFCGTGTSTKAAS